MYPLCVFFKGVIVTGMTGPRAAGAVAGSVIVAGAGIAARHCPCYVSTLHCSALAWRQRLFIRA